MGTSGAVLDAQHHVLGKLDEARSCRQQFEVVEKQVDLAREKVTSIEAASVEATARSKTELARLQKEYEFR